MAANVLPMQPSANPVIFTDVDTLTYDVSPQPDTPIEVRFERFVEGYPGYYDRYKTANPVFDRLMYEQIVTRWYPVWDAKFHGT